MTWKKAESIWYYPYSRSIFQEEVRDVDRPYAITAIIIPVIIIIVINIFSASRSVRFIQYFKNKFVIYVKLLQKNGIVNSFIFQELVSIQSIYETTGFKKNKMNSKVVCFSFNEMKIICIMISLKTC